MRSSILLATLIGLTGLTLAVPVGSKLEDPGVSVYKREPERDNPPEYTLPPWFQWPAPAPGYKREAKE
ncbi:MAG: hypothetical protein Q9223_002773 [Gallowayella weberi]